MAWNEYYNSAEQEFWEGPVTRAALLEEIRETENLAASPETNDPTAARARLELLRKRLSELKGGEQPRPEA